MRLSVFEQARTISTPEIAIRYGLELRKRGKNYFALCPFHPDRQPSLVIYPNGFKCFGCQACGDGIELAARLLSLRPYEAARQVCMDFGLPIDQPLAPEARQKAAEAARERAQEKEAREFFNWLVDEVHSWFVAYYRAIDKILACCGPFAWPELIHSQVWLEHLLDILEAGDVDTKLKAVESFVEGTSS
ncbi:MAG: CHC2 zinc finger domain-containing protein [Bacillota bacterium]